MIALVLAIANDLAPVTGPETASETDLGLGPDPVIVTESASASVPVTPR